MAAGATMIFVAIGATQMASVTHWSGGWLAGGAPVDDAVLRRFADARGLPLGPAAVAWTSRPLVHPGTPARPIHAGRDLRSAGQIRPEHPAGQIHTLGQVDVARPPPRVCADQEADLRAVQVADTS